MKLLSFILLGVALASSYGSITRPMKILALAHTFSSGSITGPAISQTTTLCKGTNGKSYASGEGYTIGCFHYTCGNDGILNVRIEDSCCLHEGNYYPVGDVVKEIPVGKDCVLEQTVCKDTGYVIKEPVYGKCNCELNGDVVRDGEDVLLSTGAKASCCGGNMVTPVNKTLLKSGVKLVGGIKPGMGDVYLNGFPVGDCDWDSNAASILCNDLGFGEAMETFHRKKKSANEENYSIRCEGDEASINNCKITKECKSGAVASIRCRRVKIEDDDHVFLDGQAICIDGESEMIMEASALCRELGFSNGLLKASTKEISRSSAKNISCSGFLLSECITTECSQNSLESILDCTNKMDIELVGGNGDNEGNVYFRGGPVCDDDFGILDANVICQELGFKQAEKVLTKSYFGLVKLPFALDNVDCKGNETKLSECEAAGPMESNCKEDEGAGVICQLNSRVRFKRFAATAMAAAPLVMQGIDTASSIVGSVVNYFDEKEKRHQEYLKERPDKVDLTTDKISIKMSPEAGYIDPSGEFRQGGFKLDIGSEGPPQKEGKDGGPAFTYSHGIGPMLMNGCFGSNYLVGDPCYAAKWSSTKCLDMIESANFVGVGFDGTGEYTHANRKKTLIQRQCTDKSTYQGEDVPDSMNIFGIYDTACTGKSFETLEARSEYQRQQSDMGSNTDLLKYKGGSDTKVNAKLGFLSASASLSHSSHSQKQTTSSSKRRSMGKAGKTNKATKEMVYEFTCTIRRYNIFLDEVTPSMLSEAFLQDYMNLPIRYYDFRHQAPLKYGRFLQRWGTHYIKSANFGGKFTLLRKSRVRASESEVEWKERIQEDTSQMFESKESSTKARAGYSVWSASVGGSGTTSNSQTSQSSAQSSNSEKDTNLKNKKATSYSMDDIIVEGGDHKVASILADKHRAGFKGEFKAWLDSIPKYPKGYDFVFGELSELLDMRYKDFLTNGIEPCWKFNERFDLNDERGNSICGNYDCLYNATTKNEDGDEVVEVRKCQFQDSDDFEEKMQRKLLSLKRAVEIFIKTGGRSTTEVAIPGGDRQCENRKKTYAEISYEEILQGGTFEVEFDMREDIGDEILKDETLYISFKHSKNDTEEGKKGRWAVDDTNSNTFAGQYSKKLNVDLASKEVLINGVKFTYESDNSGNYLMMTKEDCEINRERITSMRHKECNETRDIYWINVPLATVRPINPPETFYPCYLEWSNVNMLMSESSCVRFTATSEGPIYFALAAIPNRPDAMYYLRISTSDITIYKNLTLMEDKTRDISAVGLGHRDIFQSYIICSEHEQEKDSQDRYTKITYGKLEADETIKRDATLNAYLIMKDDKSPIEPTFFAFGSGEEKVQIVDLQLLDMPTGSNIQCRGDTIASNGQCIQACWITKIAEISKQTVKLQCYKEGTKELYDNSTSHVGESSYCEALCPEGQVAYPARTVCRGDSSWSDQLNCYSECDKDDPSITIGQLVINGKKESKVLPSLQVDCPNQSDFADLIIKGVKCEISCGTDEHGLIYKPIGDIECSDTSNWNVASKKKKVQHVCRSLPCSPIIDVPNGIFSCNQTDNELEDSENELGSGHDSDGSFPEDNGSSGRDYVSEGTTCVLESCNNKYKKEEPASVTCNNGEWRHGGNVKALQCIPEDQTCSVPIPLVDHATVSCEDKDKTNTEEYLGGTTCEATCDAADGYRPADVRSSIIQCINGKWDIKVTCINTCPAQSAIINNGDVSCNDEDRAVSGEYLHGTSCSVNCQWGHKLRDASAKAKCINGQWSTNAVCIEKSCPIKLPAINNGNVTCSDEDRDESGQYTHGASCNVNCHQDYTFQDDNSNIQCNYGQWSTIPVCIEKHCAGHSAKLEHAKTVICDGGDKIHGYNYRHGTICNVECDDEYRLENTDKKFECIFGKWSKPICALGSVYFIAGGKGASRDISVYHPTVDNVACSIIPPTLNNNWFYHTTFYHDNTIYLCGGSNTASTCISHNKDTEGWKTHTLTTARWRGHSSVVLDNRVYFIGGRGDSSHRYVGASSTPLPLTDTPVLTPQHNLDYKGEFPCTARIDQDTLVVTGGFHGGSWLTTVTTYNVKTRTYKRLPSLKQPRYSHGCGVLERGNTKWIIVAGGDGGGYLQSTEMLQLGGSEWISIGNLNVARYGYSMAVTQRGVMVMGGHDTNENILSNVELLDWDNAGKTWSVVQPSLNKPRSWFGGAVEIPASMFGCTG